MWWCSTMGVEATAAGVLVDVVPLRCHRWQNRVPGIKGGPLLVIEWSERTLVMGGTKLTLFLVVD